MNVKISEFLVQQKNTLKKLIDSLSNDFPYVSILGTDSKAISYRVLKTSTSIAESPWAERGFVVRIFNGKGYSEYSFNELDKMEEVESAIRQIAREDIALLENKGVDFIDYPLIEEEYLNDSFYGDVKIIPDSLSPEETIQKLTDIKNKGLKMDENLIDMRVNCEHFHISKMFLSNKKDLEQSYIFSSAMIVAIGKRNESVKFYYEDFSGLKGSEILDEIENGLPSVLNGLNDLLSAERLIPGEYDIICDPSMAGLIAHEAFGHGVEMDMFVKERAKAVEYMNKRVGSDKVMMHDGAKSAQQVSSYLFDDEGVIGTDTLIIDKGILKSGISDLLSAMKLGTVPTGNGKRESYERKAYSRMTNTFFAPGDDSLDDMIESTKKGYLLESYSSGMEDPKNWGIQCVAMKGREIIDGKMTGKIVAPIYLTGYVPDLLQSISMVSGDLELSGGGACGKGYKEMVKTSIGGPFLKAKGRLA